MNNPRILDILSASQGLEQLSVRGWVRTKRESKDMVFLEINDGSCLKNLQAVIDKNRHELIILLEKVHTGASLHLTGALVSSPGGGQSFELKVESLIVIGTADPETYPLQKKRHSFEFLREIAHLRPRTNTFGAVARLRNVLAMAIHEFFQERGYLWVHTPIITASDAEGAGEMFQVTTLDLQSLAKKPQEGGVDYSQDFFGKKAHLTVSGQLNGETYASALGRIYTFGPTFRAENSNTSRHLAEFWMIEPETAFLDIDGNMDLAESFIRFVLGRALDRSAADLEFFDERIQPGIIESLRHVTDSSFERISYTEAIERLQKSGTGFEYPVAWGKDLQSEHERYLTEVVFKRPVMVTGYPKEIKAFYMKLNDDGKTVRGMDVLVPRLGEIIGGSEREENLDTLLARMNQLGLNESDYSWYLDLRRFGTVPHSGFGLGFERLIQYVSGMQNIRDVIPFPRTPKSADF